MKKTFLMVLAEAALAVTAVFASHTAVADDFTVDVPFGTTNTIDAAFISAIGEKNLVKTGRGVLVGSADMAAYTGTITVREGAFEVTTSSDLGTADGGTVVEDGGTLVVNMAAKDQSFGGEVFTIAGTGDATYGAAIYQATGKNDQNKLFKNIVLSDDATIFSGTHLGMASGSLTMNGHALTVKGTGVFTFRVTQTPAPVGNLIVESGSVRFRGGSNATGDASKALTVRSGSTLVLGVSGDNVPPIWWNLVVEEGGKVLAEASQGRTYYGDVEWNSTVADSASGPLMLNGEVTGTGVIKSSGGTLTFAKPLGENVGLGLSGTATALLPPPKAYSYEHKGMRVGHRNDQQYKFDSDATGVTWSYCSFGPGPQLVKSPFWDNSSSAQSWCSDGYLWNREATNVTYTLLDACTRENRVYVDGTLVMQRTKTNTPTVNENPITVPAGSCVHLRVFTSCGGEQGGPTESNNSTKFRINGVVARDETGWFFTTNNVSGPEGLSPLPTLSLGNGGVLDANNMPLTVSNLVGGAVVTNVTTLTVSGFWTLTASELADDNGLKVFGDLVIGVNVVFDVDDFASLPRWKNGNPASYTLVEADSITGFQDGMELSDSRGRKWRLTLSADGKSATLDHIPKGMLLSLH